MKMIDSSDYTIIQYVRLADHVESDQSRDIFSAQSLQKIEVDFKITQMQNTVNREYLVSVLFLLISITDFRANFKMG